MNWIYLLIYKSNKSNKNVSVLFFPLPQPKKKKAGKSQANCYYENAASELLLGTSKQNTCRAMESSGN